MSKCISSHGEYSKHEPGDPCPWCGEYDTERIIAERDAAAARIQAVRDVLDAAEDRGPIGLAFDGTPFPLFVSSDDIRRALDGEQ